MELGRQGVSWPWEDRGSQTQRGRDGPGMRCVPLMAQEGLCPSILPNETCFHNSLRNRCLRTAGGMLPRVSEGCEHQGGKRQEIPGQGESQS